MRPIVLLFLLSFPAYGQKEVKPSSVSPLNFSAAGETKFLADVKRLEEIAKKIEAGAKIEDFPAADQELWKTVDEMNYWDTQGPGCSWYCGGIIESVSTSSTLKAQGANTYDGANAHDFSYKTAWVEGVKGYGIGEHLTYTFPADCPRVTTVIIANGYVKSEQAYRENSRVKKLKMYVNDKPYAILDLADNRSEQRFKFDPIGNSDRTSRAALMKQGKWTMKFEILEVYPGTKYDDVVISELWFDGIDVH